MIQGVKSNLVLPCTNPCQVVAFKAKIESPGHSSRINYNFFIVDSDQLRHPQKAKYLLQGYSGQVPDLSTNYPDPYYLQNPNLRSSGGFLSYTLIGENRADSTNYYPKSDPLVIERFNPQLYAIRQLGYFIERQACVDLIQSHGIEFFSTPDNSSKDRKDQLRKVGLDPFSTYSAQEWLAGMDRGIGRAMERHQNQNI